MFARSVGLLPKPLQPAQPFPGGHREAPTVKPAGSVNVRIHLAARFYLLVLRFPICCFLVLFSCKDSVFEQLEALFRFDDMKFRNPEP